MKERHVSTIQESKNEWKEGKDLGSVERRGISA